jgi:hypothetical protein
MDGAKLPPLLPLEIYLNIEWNYIMETRLSAGFVKSVVTAKPDDGRQCTLDMRRGQWERFFQQGIRAIGFRTRNSYTFERSAIC